MAFKSKYRSRTFSFWLQPHESFRYTFYQTFPVMTMILHSTGNHSGAKTGVNWQKSSIFGYIVGIKLDECSQKRQILNWNFGIKQLYIAWIDIYYRQNFV